MDILLFLPCILYFIEAFLRFLVFFILTTLFSCQTSSLEEFQFEGAAQVRLLIEDLRAIETREDLLLAEHSLKKHFEKIVETMIQARVFQQKNVGLEVPTLQLGQVVSQDLLDEMKRIYSFEGGRECIERAQREAMLKLDAKEKMLNKSLQGSYFN